jgi:hypothetical protein
MWLFESCLRLAALIFFPLPVFTEHFFILASRTRRFYTVVLRIIAPRSLEEKYQRFRGIFCLHLPFWRWKSDVPLKCLYLHTRLHGVMTRNSTIKNPYRSLNLKLYTSHLSLATGLFISPLYRVSLDSSVSEMNRQSVSLPRRHTNFSVLHSSQRSDQHKGLPSALPRGYRGLFAWEQSVRRVKLATHIHLVPSLRMSGTTPPLLYGVLKENFTHTFTLTNIRRNKFYQISYPFFSPFTSLNSHYHH